MSENILLDGSIPTGLIKEFDLALTDQNNASLVVSNPSGTINLELKCNGSWVPVDIIDVTQQTLGIYTSGKFRVSASSLGATESVSLHR